MSRSDQDFIAAGVAIVKERGFSHLSSRTLGEAMGVHSTAIYRHFPQWDLLVMAVTDRLFGALARDGMKTLEQISDPRERLLALMGAVRQEAQANPEIALNLLKLAATPVSVATPNLDLVATMVVDALRDMGLVGEQLVTAYQALENFTVGSSATDFAGFPSHLENRLGRRRMVGITELTQAAQSTDEIQRINDEAFWFGAHALLDRCEALAKG